MQARTVSRIPRTVSRTVRTVNRRLRTVNRTLRTVSRTLRTVSRESRTVSKTVRTENKRLKSEYLTTGHYNSVLPCNIVVYVHNNLIIFNPLKYIIMKTIFNILLFSLLLISTAKGQCIEGMPNDTAICANSNASPITLTFGGNPVLVNGTAPFVYSWSVNPYSLGSNTWHASDILDDTTVINPTILYNILDNPQPFYLTITDANGFSCTDSLIIQVSGYVAQLWDCIIFVNIGDTVSIYPTFYGGIPPVNYSWSPTISISNSNEPYPLVFPDSSITYTVVLTDSIGCQVSSNCNVYIYPTIVEEINKTNTQPIKIVDILGKESSSSKKGLLFYIYDDGTVEKRIMIE